MLKPNETHSTCKKVYIILEKNVATDKKCILRNMDLKCQNPKFSILCKITNISGNII